MLYLYLDESGDLGFDFFTKSPSQFFTVCVLAVQGSDHNRRLLSAVKKTCRRKLAKSPKVELKGAHSSLQVKKYFYNLVADVPFEIYALTLNKRRVYNDLASQKDKLYNFIARNVLDQLPIERATTRVYFIIDRSKSKREIDDFNGYITRQLFDRLYRKVRLDIFHHGSSENRGLQAADLFAWGIFRKYEHRDELWLDVFRAKIRYEHRYL